MRTYEDGWLASCSPAHMHMESHVQISDTHTACFECFVASQVLDSKIQNWLGRFL
jgi:hypothetical protein